ncbi:Bidirectional sugar transporter SWEET [Citrus sinensis]|uniref:Bidirectional sugar transporter SWEET n=1 Tax=Citrus sinensis TaxID=2711 RepID=A0ACB8KLY0_CITSI|nr:Bidirectional sugar transporter SWEET [Citrus sinensis]
MASLSFFVGIIGNVISLLVFASPIKTFWQIVKKKSTESYKGVPYITTLMSTSLWTFYGVMKPGGLLVATVNGAGAALQFIYVSLYLIYAPKDKKVKTAKLVAILDVGFLGAVIAITLLAMHGNLRLTFVGILCAALTIGMYASPLAVMTTVIRTKSVKYMPFLLSFFLFLNAGVWSVYSVLVKDIYIGVSCLFNLLYPELINIVPTGCLQVFTLIKTISGAKCRRVRLGCSSVDSLHDLQEQDTVTNKINGLG